MQVWKWIFPSLPLCSTETLLLWIQISFIMMFSRPEVPNPWTTAHYQATACLELGCASCRWMCACTQSYSCVNGGHLCLCAKLPSHEWWLLALTDEAPSIRAACVHVSHSQGTIPSPTQQAAKPERLRTIGLGSGSSFCLPRFFS